MRRIAADPDVASIEIDAFGGAQQYVLTDIGTLTQRSSHGTRINQTGQIAGFSTISGQPGTPKQPAIPYVNHAFLWSANDGQPIATLAGHESHVYSLAFHPGGHLVSADLQGSPDAFVKLQLRWGDLRRFDRAPAYLRSTVLNGARSQLRHHKVRDRHLARRTVTPAIVTPESSLLEADTHERVVAALRTIARQTKDGPQARRLLALAAIYEGASRTEAARIGGVTGQIVRDWVVKFSAHGPEGLVKELDVVKDASVWGLSTGGGGCACRVGSETDSGTHAGDARLACLSLLLALASDRRRGICRGCV